MATRRCFPPILFHQTVILIVGSFVIRWNMGILPKLLIITVISFPMILVLYEVLVRRTNVTRFLFGIKLKDRRQRRGLPHAVRQEA